MATDTLSHVSQSEVATTVIQPRRPLWHLELGHLWEYHELLFFLVWRDVKVRYKQTALGVAWAILQPLMATLIFSIFFGRLGQNAVGRYSVPGICIRSLGAVAVLCERA